jgi:glycosyltransferase involved in cell wall biosynthesis
VRFFIAVPTYQSAEFLGRSLASLLEAQPGAFDLHVRVQDGGSTDGTLAVAEGWARRIANGEVPDAARRRLTVVSARDLGLYDAVACAFDSVASDGHDVITWLGSDDLLMPGALATVARVFERFPELRWLTGMPQVIDHEGAWYTGWPLGGFARRNLRRGLHDGRGLPFVMQEGTFWRTTLYREAGGLRRDLRLAGDFDLWRRFARTDELVMCSFPLGAWRQRRGQASGDRSAYYREVEQVLSEDPASPIDEEAARADAALRYRPIVLDRLFGKDYALRVEGLPFHPLGGFGPPESPAPKYDLHSSFIRMVGPAASLRIPMYESGVPYRFALRFRNAHPDRQLTLRMGEVVVHDAALTCCDADASQVVAFTCTPATSEPVLTVECRSGGERPARRGLLDRLRRRVERSASKTSELLVEDLAFERLIERRAVAGAA